MEKTIFIIGSNGQDGQVLQSLLKFENARVFRKNRNHILTPEGHIISNSTNKDVENIFRTAIIDELYFFAAPNYSASNNLEIPIGVEIIDNINLISDELIFILDLIVKFQPSMKIFFASSALVFGEPSQFPQDEKTKFAPQEIYGLFKKLCQDILLYYRDTKSLFIVIGVLYPHESEYRKSSFLLPTIIRHAFNAQFDDELRLNIANLEFKREWNCAYQVVLASKKLLNLKTPDLYVIGSGKQFSVGEVCQIVYSFFNLNYEKHVVLSEHKIMSRSSNLIADPEKILSRIGFYPDGDVQSLVSRICSKMSLGAK